MSLQMEGEFGKHCRELPFNDLPCDEGSNFEENCGNNNPESCCNEMQLESHAESEHENSEDYPTDGLLQELQFLNASCEKSVKFLKRQRKLDVLSSASKKKARACVVNWPMSPPSNVIQSNSDVLDNFRVTNTANNIQDSGAIADVDEESKGFDDRVLVIDASDETPPSKKHKLKRAKYTLNKRKKLCMSEIPDEIVSLIHSGVGNNLEEKADRTRLTAVHVKSIIHNVLTNEHVLAMMKNTLGKLSVPAMYEPKLTRAKTRELLEKHQGPTNDLLLSNFGCAENNSETLISGEFPEDEDDDEYDPEADEQPWSDDESFLSESLGGSELGSPCPATPGSSHFSQGSQSPMTTPQSSSCAAGNLPRIVELKIPYMGHSVMKKVVQRTLDFEKSISVQDNNDEYLSERTRSKRPMTETTLESLESAFVPPDITRDMYETECFDDEWRQFLMDFVQPLKTVAERTEDEEADPEYNILEDQEDVVDLVEDMRRDKAVQISKREFSELMTELLDSLDPGDESEDELNQKIKNIHHWGGKSKQKTQNQPQKLLSGVQVGILTAKFTPEQVAVLKCQMTQHVQLLLTSALMSHGEPALENVSTYCTQYLEELKRFADESDMKESSVFNACNLKEALTTIGNLNENVENDQRSIVNTRQLTVKEKRLLITRSELDQTVIASILDSMAFPFLDLLPPRMFSNPIKCVSKPYFTASEDTLFAMGLMWHADETCINLVPGKAGSGSGKIIKRMVTKKLTLNPILKLISETMTMTKSPQQLFLRLKNVWQKCNDIPDNPILQYVKTKNFEIPRATYHPIPLGYPCKVVSFPFREFAGPWKDIVRKRQNISRYTPRVNILPALTAVTSLVSEPLTLLQPQLMNNVYTLQTIDGNQVVFSQVCDLTYGQPLYGQNAGEILQMNALPVVTDATLMKTFMSMPISTANENENILGLESNVCESVLTGSSVEIHHQTISDSPDRHISMPVISAESSPEKNNLLPQIGPLAYVTSLQYESDNPGVRRCKQDTLHDMEDDMLVDKFVDNGKPNNDQQQSSEPQCHLTVSEYINCEKENEVKTVWSSSRNAKKPQQKSFPNWKNKLDKNMLNGTDVDQTNCEINQPVQDDMIICSRKRAKLVINPVHKPLNISQKCKPTKNYASSVAAVQNKIILPNNSLKSFSNPILCDHSGTNPHPPMSCDSVVNLSPILPKNYVGLNEFVNVSNSNVQLICPVPPLNSNINFTEKSQNIHVDKSNDDLLYTPMKGHDGVSSDDANPALINSSPCFILSSLSFSLSPNGNSSLSRFNVPESPWKSLETPVKVQTIATMPGPTFSNLNISTPVSLTMSVNSCSYLSQLPPRSPLFLCLDGADDNVSTSTSCETDTLASGLSNTRRHSATKVTSVYRRPILSVVSPCDEASGKSPITGFSPTRWRPILKSPLKTSPLKQVSPILRKYHNLSPMKNSLHFSKKKMSPILPKYVAPQPVRAKVRSLAPKCSSPITVVDSDAKHSGSTTDIRNSSFLHSKIRSTEDELISMEESALTTMQNDDVEFHQLDDEFDDFDDDDEEMDTEELAQQQEEHLAALLRASSTIASKRTDLTLHGEKKLTKQQERLRARISSLTCVPDVAAQDKEYAQSYLLRVKKALMSNTNQFQQFLQVLAEFKDSDGDSPIQLYKKMTEILQAHPDLSEEFISFLLPHQAAAIGKFQEYSAIHQMLNFLQKIKAEFRGKPQYIVKIMRTMQTLQNRTNVTVEEVKRIMAPLLRYPHLMEDFCQFIPTEAPLPSLPEDFEEVDMLHSGSSPDSVECIELPEEDLTTSPEHCVCSCHATSANLRSLHCNSCAIRFLEGRVYLQSGKTLRPAKVIYQDDLLTQQKVNKVDIGTSKRDLGECIEMNTFANEFNPDSNKHMKTVHRITMREAVLESCMTIANEAVHSSHGSGLKSSLEVNNSNFFLCSPPKELFDDNALLPPCLPSDSRVPMKLSFQVGDFLQENILPSRSPEILTDSLNLQQHKGQICFIGENIYQSSTHETNESFVSQEDESCASFDSLSPASMSNCSNVITMVTENWTKEEDYVILDTLRQIGNSQNAYDHVFKLLHGRKLSEVQSRFQELVKLMIENISANDSQSSEDEMKI